VAAHCWWDVRGTKQLAERLGYLKARELAEVL
jgi:hypothetical protein